MKTPCARIVSFMCAILATLVVGCSSMAVDQTASRSNSTKAKEHVLAALSHYRELVVRMEPADISLFFVDQGSVSHGTNSPITGRQAIQAFMASFASYKIVQYDLNATSTHVEDSTATQVGTYLQVVTDPAGQTMTVQGTFTAKWERQPGNRWLLGSMHTESMPL